MNIQCHLLTPTAVVEVFLRRFTFSNESKCPLNYGYHNANVILERRPKTENDICGDTHPHDDPRWPKQCGCGYLFKDTDEWQLNIHKLFQRSDNGELTTLHNATVGAMWFADWMENSEYTGPDGRTLVVRLPHNHDWIVDGRANNCDSPCAKCGKVYHAHPGGLCRTLQPGEDIHLITYVDARPHKCWVRHGEAPNIHVDKNGVTCGAGAGSIGTPKYHGFLHNGHLTNC